MCTIMRRKEGRLKKKQLHSIEDHIRVILDKCDQFIFDPWSMSASDLIEPANYLYSLLKRRRVSCSNKKAEAVIDAAHDVIACDLVEVGDYLVAINKLSRTINELEESDECEST